MNANITEHVMYERGINDAKQAFKNLLKSEIENLTSVMNSINDDGIFEKKDRKFDYISSDLVRLQYKKQIEQCKILYNKL